ncbi:hypothetical protein [Lonomia obliqua multiple nucleopolyhedrovirus]|uniref:Uncharacterized protein n=1 Tax=Lonomia obliqua multiple nucleopolyhedrovirus TaxID=134394 RepID=A0A126FCA2_9ABAC|nr:hypothetical protein [Lonomia obliqua multiple nucleopolyhedrovirus]AKN81018.1 hypothetical protein [Lonomia obliqua multiple nucleopolyhedrovirus]
MCEYSSNSSYLLLNIQLNTYLHNYNDIARRQKLELCNNLTNLQQEQEDQDNKHEQKHDPNTITLHIQTVPIGSASAAAILMSDEDMRLDKNYQSCIIKNL